MALDPNDYDISELGPEIQDVEDVDELEDILETEKAGKDRAGAKQLIQSRIEKFREDEADFYRDILEQERQYARTKSFW